MITVSFSGFSQVNGGHINYREFGNSFFEGRVVAQRTDHANLDTLTSVIAGTFAYDTLGDVLVLYDGSSWVDVGAGGGGGSSEWTRSGDYVYPNNITDSIGIGTETPLSKLDIQGGFHAHEEDTAGIVLGMYEFPLFGGLLTAINNGFTAYKKSGDWLFQNSVSSNNLAGDLLSAMQAVNTQGSEIRLINCTRNGIFAQVGDIGEPNNSFTLNEDGFQQVLGHTSDSRFLIEDSLGNDLIYATSNSIRIGDNGNVQLTYTDGNEAADRVLTSDANGNATWKTPSTSIYNADGTLTGTRTLEGNGNTLLFNDIGNFNVSTVSNLELESTGNDILISADLGDINLDASTVTVESGLIYNDNPQDGYVLTSDATGNATWRESGPQNVIVVNTESDLPTAFAGVRTLADETVYQISGNIDIGSDRIVTGVNTTIRGNSPALDFITSSTTGALITSSTNFRLFEVGFSAASGTIFDLNGTGSEICLMFGVRFFGGGGIGTVDAYDLFEITTGLFVGYNSGLTFTGSGVTCLFIDVTFFDTAGVTSVDFGTSTFSSVKIANCDFTVPNGGTALDIAPLSANINAGGAGIITGCSFNLSGTGASTTGYEPTDDQWAVNLSNVGIKISDRLLPQGWEFSEDDVSATQVFDSTPSQLSINGSGSSSDDSHIPLVIRGTDNLWNTTTDKVEGITSGDTYDIRVSLEITSTSSNPTRISMFMDIGSTQDGTGTGSSIIIVSDSKTLKNGTPQSHVFNFPIFTGSTFLANGGSFWITVDSGTATISDRSILLVRTTSGSN